MCVCAFDTLSREFGLGTVTFPVATFLRKKRLTRAETSLLFWQQRRVHEVSKFNVTPFSVSFFLHSLFSFLPLFFFPFRLHFPFIRVFSIVSADVLAIAPCHAT